MRTVPERVCLVERSPAYLNFDLLIRNSTSAELAIEKRYVACCWTGGAKLLNDA
jgi:hypothetical protein